MDNTLKTGAHHPAGASAGHGLGPVRAVLACALMTVLFPPAVAAAAGLAPGEGEVIVRFKSDSQLLRRHALAARAPAADVNAVLAREQECTLPEVGCCISDLRASLLMWPCRALRFGARSRSVPTPACCAGRPPGLALGQAT